MNEPPPGSVPHFLCGTGGCQVEYESPGVHEAVSQRRKEWARWYRSKHGEYPDGETQLFFVARVTEEEEFAARRRHAIRAANLTPTREDEH
ncbi:MAG TPA: hypothetical protein VNA25_22695 [Phycisphaerae bacterium]|nr:hypothetical protein [Phycisphaerae bacterium]